MMKNHSKHWSWSVCLLLAIASAQAETVDSAQPNLHKPAQGLMLAMGELGAIHNSLAPNDPATQLSWSQLSNEQRIVLAPLGGEWDSLRPWQREKMLDIVSDYPKMDAQQQLRLQRRLIKWSRMTPYERENARKRYQQFQSLSQTQKEDLRQKWQAHQHKTGVNDGDDLEFSISVP